jgi:tRNA-guanine family transglycosylase
MVQVSLLEFVMPQLPAGKPNHLLGIADVPSIEACVPLGVDTFDSCFPTRLGRHNTLLTREGRLNIKKRVFERDFRPLDEQCECHTCRNHTYASRLPPHTPDETIGQVADGVSECGRGRAERKWRGRYFSLC